MSVDRSLAAGLEYQLDAIDQELAGLARIQWRETRDGLARLGFDVTNYTEPRYPRPVESAQRTRVLDRPRAAQATAAERGRIYRFGIGQVLQVR
jgi:hypothetical protein